MQVLSEKFSSQVKVAIHSAVSSVSRDLAVTCSLIAAMLICLSGVGVSVGTAALAFWQFLQLHPAEHNFPFFLQPHL